MTSFRFVGFGQKAPGGYDIALCACHVRDQNVARLHGGLGPDPGNFLHDLEHFVLGDGAVGFHGQSTERYPATGFAGPSSLVR